MLLLARFSPPHFAQVADRFAPPHFAFGPDRLLACAPAQAAQTADRTACSLLPSAPIDFSHARLREIHQAELGITGVAAGQSEHVRLGFLAAAG